MDSSRPIIIIGGGLTGLALGAALARAGAGVTVCEAGKLPRHRVCGEFLSGLRPGVIARLGLAPRLRDAAVNRVTGWHAGGRLRFAATLPEPAYGLSRLALETRLMSDLAKAGGVLQENTRVQEEGPGQVWTAGRRPATASRWLGLKIHCRNLRLEQDLEIHLGRGGYVGTARIEDGRVNICGLFRVRPKVRAPRETMLVEYLKACGLGGLAERIAAADPDAASASAVSGLDFSRTWGEEARFSLGDHYAPIPPYTGHGMALALENAATALEPLLAYARGDEEWTSMTQRVRTEVTARQRARVRWARLLHPCLLNPVGKAALLALAGARLLPFRMLYRATHGGGNGSWKSAAKR
jgi:2-polyprenyl-6-methoxyphenol hydroxylase-like FAD-dependent oxidoreductase